MKGKQHAEINVMGIAYRPDGNIAAKFSDSVKKDFDDKKEAEKFAQTPLHYENQFDLGSGEYTLKVVFTAAGAGFGKLEAPLKIDAYDTSQFSMSALALSKAFRKLSADVTLDQQLVEGKTPLTTGGMQFDPAGVTQFKADDTVAVYFEVYDPLLQEQAPAKPVQLGAVMRIVDRKSGEQKLDSGTVEVSNFVRAGNPVAPIALKVPVNTLTAGRLQAGDQNSGFSG